MSRPGLWSHTAVIDTSPDTGFSLDWRTYDDLQPDQRWSTWLSVEPLCRGPEPRPDWLVQSRGAVDTELGILKTGKEADVFLLERADEQHSVVMAAKRYRDEQHRSFHRSTLYTEGRRTRNSRDIRALRKKTAHGRSVAAGQWAWAEWEALVRCHAAGVPVPYPVQIDGTELLLEWITDAEGHSAPRLAQVRPDATLLQRYFDQAVQAVTTMVRLGLVHGDLSPYNILATGDRLVLMDLPQVVDLAANPAGMDLLLRDCSALCRWFSARGLAVDEHQVYAEVLAHGW